VSAISLKLKFATAALLAAAIAVVAFGGVLLWEHVSVTDNLAVVAADAARQRVRPEVEARAAAAATQAAAVLSGAIAERDAGAIRAAMQPFTRDAVHLVVKDNDGVPLYEWDAPRAAAASAAATATAPVMHEAEDPRQAPRRIGQVEVAMLPVPGGGGDLLPATVRRAGSANLRNALLLTAALGAAGAALGAILAWRTGRRIEQPIVQLIRSAERFGQGDYSRPLEVERRDEIGELQGALERMRQKLRQTTITRDYLTNILNGMADAVFVTSPDGVIKFANFAASRLLGYGEDEILGRSIIAMLDERERSGFDLAQAANDTRETVVRTRDGQTIPISLSGSHLASDDPQFQGNVFIARNITDRKRAERRIRYLARYDALTKVPNRMQFHHLLQQGIARTLRARQSLALLYLDMDRFKEVNDTFGHASGDRVLEVLTERLSRALPKDAVVGRLAGDEFALFIDGLPGDADNRGPIAQLARSILTEVSRAFTLNQHEVFLTASIGIAFCPRDAENVIDLIRNADAAMYYSKQNGGNTFAFYSPEMNAAAVERLMLKSKLRRALERDELVVRYQPKVDLRTGRIIGAEALLRWRLPGHGDIPPSQFIPLAEESNLILDIGEWVLDRCCLDFRQMQSRVSDPGRISLNLSLKQLRQASFILRCRSVFRRHGVSPTSFELEITETTLMADAKRTLRLLDELFAMGLHLSIDDFGTGYSSLSALQQFPIGTLKIDQSFVRDVPEDSSDATIVRTIIDMGRSLGMDVIAEGIEAAKHVAFLRDHGCYYGQGRLFGEPCTAEELLALLSQQANGTPPFAHVIPSTGNTGRLPAPRSA